MAMSRFDIDTMYARMAEELPDEVLSVELTRARRALMHSVRTRKEFALHKVACLECELKRRSDQRHLRNRGRA